MQYRNFKDFTTANSMLPIRSIWSLPRLSPGQRGEDTTKAENGKDDETGLGSLQEKRVIFRYDFHLPHVKGEKQCSYAETEHLADDPHRS